MNVEPGSIDVKTYFMMRLVADGTAATGLTPANFDLTYTRSGATAVKVDATLNGNGVGGAHSDSTVIEVDATNSPGLYRADWVDAAFAAGVPEVICTVKVATAFTEPLRVELKSLTATALANLESQYDTTGLVGDPFPLRQDQGASISGGLAVHETAESVTVIEGTEQDLADTGASNNSRWTGDDVGAGAEFIFRFVPADTDSSPGDLHFEGFYAEPGAPFANSATIETYNFHLARWDVQETLANSGVDETHDNQLSNAYRSPNNDTIETVVVTRGDVLVKFQQTSQETGDGVLNIDKITVGFISAPLTASEIVDEWETQSQADPTGFHVNVLELAGDEQSTADLKDFVDLGYDPATKKVQGVVLVDTTTTNTDMRGNDSANTVEPDPAGSAATLHGVTDGKIDALVATVGPDGDGLSKIPWNASWDAEVQSEVNDALVAIHLDHLLAVNYDPADKPGAATALLNELIVDDSGVSQFSINALENAPSGTGSSPAVIAAAVWDALRANHIIVGSFGESNQVSSSTDVSVSFVFGGTGYCSRSDINDIFGPKNVTTWADLDNDSDDDVITTSIARSIAWATTEINDRLRGGPYVIPLPVTAAATIVDLCATLAGVWLYRSRGVDDETEIDKYKWHWDRVEKTLSEIRAGKRRLNATPSVETGGQAPFAV